MASRLLVANSWIKVPVSAAPRQGKARQETREIYCQCPCLCLNKSPCLFQVFCEVTRWKVLAPHFTFGRYMNDACRTTSCSQDSKELCQLPLGTPHNPWLLLAGILLFHSLTFSEQKGFLTSEC